MPKTFSDREREYIKNKLMDEAKECLTLYGIRKTTVDELVKRVNIPKGTFYLFYDSKERLIFDVIFRFNDEIQQKLIDEAAKSKDGMDQNKLTDIIFGLYKTLDDSFMPKLISGGELEFFMKKLPIELAELHAENDNLSIAKLVSLFPDMRVENTKVFSAALRGIFLSLLYKRELGEDVFDEALRMMIRGVVIQMFERDKND